MMTSVLIHPCIDNYNRSRIYRNFTDGILQF
uniref:Uncharacterized protein n=1 Tax=Arundo donax TaxID=35708 RepID=A0A0A8YMA1_ARUDO